MEQQERQKLKDLCLKKGFEFLMDKKILMKDAEVVLDGYCSGFIDGYKLAKSEIILEDKDKLTIL